MPPRDPSPISFALFGTQVGDSGAALIGWERDTGRTRSDWVPVYEYLAPPFASRWGSPNPRAFAIAAWYEPRRVRIRAAVWRAGTPVGGRTVLGPTLCEQSPSLASSQTGHALISWHGACGAGRPDASVWTAVRSPGGPIGPAEALSEPAPLFLCGPHVAIDSAGRGIAAWCSGEGGHTAANLRP